MRLISDEERFYQCLNCLYVEDCNLDEKAEDKREMCKKCVLYIHKEVRDEAKRTCKKARKCGI